MNRYANAIMLGLLLSSTVRAQVQDTVGSQWTYATPDARFRVEVIAAGLKVPAIHCLRVASGVELGTNQVQRAPSSMRRSGCSTAPLAMHR